MKRKMTLLLSAVMVATSIPMTAYAANFKDIDDVPWKGAEEVINSVADKGLLGGYEDDTFRARNNVTHCEAMQMVYKIMVKTGMAKGFDASKVLTQREMLNAYQVPSWAQPAVVYGLDRNIITMADVLVNYSGGQKAATREEVAILFGNALAPTYGKSLHTPDANTFLDSASISDAAIEQVDILKRLGIISGDNVNRFNPKSNINRAEMAVILNKTYDVLLSETQISGELTEATRNGENYAFTVKTATGETETFRVTEGDVPVYSGETSETVAMSRLRVGEQVVFTLKQDELIEIRQMTEMTVQGIYDLTGYISSLKDNTIKIKLDNTGKDESFNIKNGADITVEGEKSSLSELRDILKERYDEHAYAGFYTRTERVRFGDNDYRDVVYVDAIDVTFTTEYMVSGLVDKFDSSSIKMELAGSGAIDSYLLADGCEYYIEESEASHSELKALTERGTTYAKVTIDQSDRAIKVVFSEENFGGTAEENLSETYELYDFDEDEMVVLRGGQKTTYTFDSANSAANIVFYTWDAANESWDEVTLSAAETYTKASTYNDGDSPSVPIDEIYCRYTFNNGGKLSEVYLSYEKDAWKEAEEFQTEKKGTVASIVDDVLKFENSSISYTLQKKYTGTALTINGTSINSKTLLARLANDSNVELYAEIKADGDNEIMEITASVTKAVGELVEWDRSGKIIEFKTADGNTFTLQTMTNPKLTDEEEGKFELEDIEDNSYAGEKIQLDFNGDGIVNRFTLLDGKKSSSYSERIKGVATAADGGLRFAGDSTVYQWATKTSDIYVTNYSGPHVAIDVIKALLADADVEVYAEISRNELGRIDIIDVYVREAKGTLKAYGDNVQIKTADGNSFVFSLNGPVTIDVDGLTKDTLGRDGIGTKVHLTFDSSGNLAKIEKA